LRVLNAYYNVSDIGQFTEKPGVLNNHFFVNLLDMNYHWRPADNALFEAVDRSSGEVKWVGSRADLIFGSNSQLRAIAEVYASDDSNGKFVKDFVAAWNKVMNLDRFDLPAEKRAGNAVAYKLP
jgi:catalase-peroxidase